MADNEKPDDFAELMRRMGQTKQFPIDLQPINPAPPVEHFSPAKMRRALAEETGLSEDDLRQLAPGFLDGKDEPDER